MKSIVKRLLWGLPLVGAMLVGACVRDAALDSPAGNTADRQMVVFNVEVPGNQTPTTRSMDGADENKIDKADILVFDVDAGGNQVFAYHEKVSTIEDKSTGGTYKFHLKAMLKAKADQNLLVVANARTEVDAAVATFTAGTTTKVQVLEALETTRKAIKSTDGVEIPMVGETGKVAVSAGQVIPTLKMVRTYARIDIENKAAGFTLTEMKASKLANGGRLAPNWNAQGVLVTTTPTTPNLLSPHVATQSETLTVAANKSIGELYVLESAANSDANETNRQNNTHIIVKGTYSGKDYYYRIDFTDDGTHGGSKGDYMAVLRNHKYVFTIDKVLGPGYLNAADAEAAYSQPNNLRYRLIRYDEGKIKFVTLGNGAMLGTSTDDITLSKEEQTFSFDMFTDWVHGASVSIPAHTGSWLTFDGGGDAADANNGGSYRNYAKGDHVVTLKAAANNTGAPRTVTLRLQGVQTGIDGSASELLSHEVKVTQTANSDGTLLITDGEGNEIDALYFDYAPGGAVTPQKFYVSWNPASVPCNIGVTTPGSADAPFAHAVPANAPTNGNITSFRAYAIQPTGGTSNDEDNFVIKKSDITFMVTNGGVTHTKTITLEQKSDIAILNQYAYAMDGAEKTFNVKSKYPWKVEVVSNDGSLSSLNAGTTSGGGNIAAPVTAPVKFTPFNDYPTMSKQFGKFKLKFSPQNAGDFEPREVEIVLASGGAGKGAEPLSNCYMLTPGGKGVLIPVKRANGFRNTTTQEPGLQANMSNQLSGAYTVEMEWSDVQGANLTGYDIRKAKTPVALMEVNTKFGTGADGHILVVPGEVAGNAVISAKVGGVVVWSWHIWVVDYAPAIIDVWMNRNLGATSETPGDPMTKGLNYQWGRSIPFPNTKDWSDGIPQTYNATGAYSAPNDGITAPNADVGGDLQKAVQNPRLLYFPTTSPNDWYGGTQKDDLWDNSGKTIYDPCPAGWRVPIRDAGKAWDDATNTKHWGNNTSNSWSAMSTSLGGFTDKGIKFWATGTLPFKGGYYPATGTRFSSGLYDVGKNGYYWSASPGSTKAYSLSFFSGLVNPNSYSGRTNGFSVRCVSE